MPTTYYSDPGVNSGEVGRPRNSAKAATPTTATSAYGAAPRDPSYTGNIQGPATPGSGWGFYWANSGRPVGNAAGGINAASNAYLDWKGTEESPLLKKQQEYSMGMLGQTPEQLRSDYYKTMENQAIRAGQAQRSQQMREAAGQAAARGMMGSGQYAGAVNAANRDANAARINALENAMAGAYSYGEQASQGRLQATAAPEAARRQSDQFNAEGLWGSQMAKYQAAADAARANAAAVGAGAERIFEFQDANGNMVNIPESMLPYYTGMS